jgi:hypothetical protein
MVSLWLSVTVPGIVSLWMYVTVLAWSHCGCMELYWHGLTVAVCNCTWHGIIVAVLYVTVPGMVSLWLCETVPGIVSLRPYLCICT